MKGKGVIIILALIIVGLGGYIVYNKLNVDENFSLENKTEIQILTGPYYTLYITKQGEAYLTFTELSANDALAENVKKLQNQYQNNKIEGYCKASGAVAKQVCPKGDEVLSIKLDVDNVIAAYSLEFGHNITDYLIGFIKTDGTISALNIGEVLQGKQMQITNNVGDLQNIVSIAKSLTPVDKSGVRSTALAIEKNGAQHDLKELLNKTA